MTTWRARAVMLALFWIVQQAHGIAMGSIPNTPASMLVYHGTAALADWLLLFIAPAFLKGRLCDEIQWLLVASIMANAAGWGLYMAYAPPSFYNSLMWWLTCAQWLRLFIPDGDDACHSRWNMVHGRHHFGHFLRFRKAYK